ncbi:MAG: hypothetical protein LBP59_17545 [Planctomycetaceae bacterium]|jgi:hypothetical protein|nr:hypothetical protein [Planctomycetaceae bacterium]
MKKTSILKNSKNVSWWKFSNKSIWLLVVGFVLFSIGYFISPSVLSNLFIGFFSLFDIRTWPWWYFIGLIIIVVFSIRWYMLYQKYVNNDFDPVSLDECKWFCALSGTITILFAIIVFLHRFSLLNSIYYPLYSWFGFGAFSFVALLIFTVIFVLIGALVFLIYQWITTLQE